MNRREWFEFSGVYAQRLRRRDSANSIEEKMVFVDFCDFERVVLLGGYSRRMLKKTTSFVIGVQMLMAQSSADLETQLIGMMNRSIRYGDMFNGYAGLISEYIRNAVSTLGPEDQGLEIWVELDKVIMHSGDCEGRISEEEELETVRYDGSGADEEEVCPVCLQSLVVGEDIQRTTCGHLFHGECIFRWLERSRTCPVCRFNMRTLVHQ
ncbi:E3 ubiquitin ligase BIG BROTHER [Acorus calamus]|uniref:E3 ubiquitin ligase BIG BROTHER n=1 Tax=Acorus calamus TaxID=4465 RepID=A0AAV9EPL2_ACOCL|nr:E3 ubiquitin ligase BIG BROTHER [Acorus calamus]